MCLLITGLVFGGDAAASAHAADKPNFVFFLVDDMGWVDPVCYGSKFHETPNIDRLATQGMRFTNAYAACPVCSPTRASIVSGKYPATLNLTDFIPGHWYPWDKLTVPEMNMNLPLKEVTFAEMLHPAGYVSGSYGKWHLGGATHFPGQQGFDEFVVTSGRHFAPRFNTNPDTPVADGTYLADFLTTQAEQFLERHKDESFVLYLPHYAVHIPLEADDKLVEKYREKASLPEFRPKLRIVMQGESEAIFKEQGRAGWLAFMQSLVIEDPELGLENMDSVRPFQGRMETTLSFSNSPSLTKLLKYAEQLKVKMTKIVAPGVQVDCRVSPVNNPTYAAMVEHIDRSLGQIMAKLDELKLAENTVLIFFSDNGGLYTSASRAGEPVMVNTPLRDEKGTLYEGGIREPLIVRWPGKIAAGAECEVPVSSVDFFPTMAELAGVTVDHPIDGQSLVPLLRQTGTFERDAIYWHYPHYHHSTPAGAIRAGDWKLIEFFEDGRVELYNLHDDLSETKNLAKEKPEKAKELRAKLADWRMSVNARMPTKNPDYDPLHAGELKRRTRP